MFEAIALERKLYISVAALLGLAGIVLAVDVLLVADSLPAIVTIGGRSVHSISRDNFVRATLLNAFLLPATCWFFAAVAHAGHIEIDVLSWLFVLGFYLMLWWIGIEVDHLPLYQIGRATTQDPFRWVGVEDPLSLLGAAVVTGLGFCKLKQRGNLNR